MVYLKQVTYFGLTDSGSFRGLFDECTVSKSVFPLLSSGLRFYMTSVKKGKITVIEKKYSLFSNNMESMEEKVTNVLTEWDQWIPTHGIVRWFLNQFKTDSVLSSILLSDSV